jgi:hypothetical protein
MRQSTSRVLIGLLGFVATISPGAAFAPAPSFRRAVVHSQSRKTKSQPFSLWSSAEPIDFDFLPRPLPLVGDEQVTQPGDAQLASKSSNSNSSNTKAVFWWVYGASLFLLYSYRSQTTWPSFIPVISLRALNFVHAMSGMIFSGGIVTTTVLEWMVVNKKKRDLNVFWFATVPRIEKLLVLPALTGSIVSGVAQSFTSYGSLRFAPQHIKSALHLLLAFGLWWAFTDGKTQQKAIEASQSADLAEIPPVFLQRRISNGVSCIFVFLLYGIMVLKPGLSKYSAV